MKDLLDDAAKSVNRLYINNFQDKNRQLAMDILLGHNATGKIAVENSFLDNTQYLLAQRYTKRLFTVRKSEYTRQEQMTLFVGTMNVNGKIPNESLDRFLVPLQGISEMIFTFERSRPRYLCHWNARNG
jgi:hypothetical protein